MPARKTMDAIALLKADHRKVEGLFADYEALSERMFRYLAEITPKPAEMKQEGYERTLKARAFDISRYLLPLGTNTSLGQIVNARTLETQIGRLLSSPFPEVVRLGELLKQAARQPAFNAQSQAVQGLVEEITALDRQLGSKASQLLLRPVSVAPTLVKYAEANEYSIKTREELTRAAREIMGNVSACHYSYRQITERVQSLSATQRAEIIDLGLRHRGQHDEPLRSYHSGQQFKFDILMDVGGFRDMHRHRRCTQIEQGFTCLHGYDTPPEIKNAGLESSYQQAMKRALAMHDQLASSPVPLAGLYVLPMAFRKRTLFKMDLAEALYIAELRTAPAGHFSYRNVAYDMYLAVAKRHPSLAKHFRITDVREPIDLLQR